MNAPVIASDSRGNEFRLEPIACPICKTRNFRTLGMRGGEYQRSKRGVPLEIVQCVDCALLWPDPFPYPVNPSELYGDPAKYFENDDEEAKVRVFREQVIRRALGQLHSKKASVLDVGSGRAELLRAARAEGIEDLVGLEFSPAMIEDAKTRYGIEVVPKTIEQYAETNERTFDLITFSAVLEHVYDPDAAMAAARKLTRPGSLVYIDVPNEPNLITAIVNAAYRLRGGKGVINLAPTFEPFHVFGFNPSSMTKLLEKHDFEVIDTRIYSEMGLPYPKTLRGQALKVAAKTVGKVANWTGTAANMYVWARRR